MVVRLLRRLADEGLPRLSVQEFLPAIPTRAASSPCSANGGPGACTATRAAGSKGDGSELQGSSSPRRRPPPVARGRLQGGELGEAQGFPLGDRRDSLAAEHHGNADADPVHAAYSPSRTAHAGTMTPSSAAMERIRCAAPKPLDHVEVRPESSAT